jgi:hypothetical protein
MGPIVYILSVLVGGACAFLLLRGTSTTGEIQWCSG